MKRPLLALFVVFGLALAGCGKSLDEQVRETVRTLDNANLKKKDVEILEVTESGDFAIAEVKVRTALKLRRTPTGWVVEEIRLGDRRWEKADHILSLLNAERKTETAAVLADLESALEKYRADHGNWPGAENFEQLIDALTPNYLPEVVRLDAWSNPFSFRLSGSGYDLRSAGPDGQLDTADDVVAMSS